MSDKRRPIKATDLARSFAFGIDKSQKCDIIYANEYACIVKWI